MPVPRVVGGEGASTLSFGSTPVVGPSLVMCPMQAFAAGMTVEMAQDLYRLAYEMARAALDPSRYERALIGCWN